MKKVLYWLVVVVVVSVAGAFGEALGVYYPGIMIQLVVAYVLYWIGKKIVQKQFEPRPSKDTERKKAVYILSGLGLLGLISPIVGFVFALPSYLIASELITKEYKERKKLVTVSVIVLGICLLNAAIGVLIYQNWN